MSYHHFCCVGIHSPHRFYIPHHNVRYSLIKSIQACNRKYPRGRQASIFSYIPDSNGKTLACPCVSNTRTSGQNLAFIHRRETIWSIHTNSRKQSQIQPQQLSRSYFNNRFQIIKHHFSYQQHFQFQKLNILCFKSVPQQPFLKSMSSLRTEEK